MLRKINIYSEREDFTKKYNLSNFFAEFACQAIFSDFYDICQLFEFATAYYKNKGIKQWEKGYDLEKIYHNILKGEAFVIRNESGVLLCTFSVAKFLPDYYPHSLVIHENIWLIKSLCTNLRQNKLIGRKVIPQIIKTALYHQISQIYLDCVMDNPTLESYYQKYGFTRIAIVQHPIYNQNMAIMILNL